MEAKVDVRKLQMLNDRIMQTLEALNQVRVSVHGIGQSPYAPWAAQSGLGHSPALGSPYASIAPTPFGTPMWPTHPQSAYYGNGLSQPYGVPGISHTPFSPSQLAPWQQVAWQSPYAQSPYAQSPYALYGQTAYSPTPYTQISPMSGLSHSGPYEEMERRIAEQRASDIGRLMHSFPYGAYV